MKLNEDITTTAIIHLLFKVIKQVKLIKPLEYRDFTISLVYVDLKADECDDYLDVDTDEVEIL